MVRSVGQYFSIGALILLIQVSIIYGRKCPDCEAQYLQCAWRCYDSDGWSPICAQLAFFTDGDAPPDPLNEDVFGSECMASCYLDAFGSFDRLSNIEKKYNQVKSAECEQAWKTQQALDYQLYSQSFQYDGLFPDEQSLPQWLQVELNRTSASNIDADEQYAILDSCRQCQESDEEGLTQTAPTPAPAPVLQNPAAGEAPIIDDIGPLTQAPAPEDIKDLPIASPSPSNTIITDSPPSAADATSASSSLLGGLSIPICFSILVSFLAYA